jgi:hypothetical protein
MFCPNCGAKNLSDQKFCRSCGMNLEQTAVALTEQFGEDQGFPQRKIDRFFENLGKFAFGGFGTVLVIGIGFLIYTIVIQLMLEGTRIAFGVFLILFIVFAALSLTYVIYNEFKKDRKTFGNSRALKQAQIVEGVPDTGKLLREPTDMPIPSVIEDTTDLLHVEARTRKL